MKSFVMVATANERQTFQTATKQSHIILQMLQGGNTITICFIILEQNELYSNYTSARF